MMTISMMTMKCDLAWAALVSDDNYDNSDDNEDDKNYDNEDDLAWAALVSCMVSERTASLSTSPPRPCNVHTLSFIPFLSFFGLFCINAMGFLSLKVFFSVPSYKYYEWLSMHKIA